MMKTTTSRRAVLGAAAAGLGALAAGAGLSRGQARQAGTPSPAAGAIPHPSGSDDLVLRIWIGGGFVPIEFQITDVPGFSVYGDGRVIFLGPQIEIFPPPALPNLRVLTLTEDGLQRVLEEADAAGLIGENREYRNTTVADAPTTVITINARDQRTVVAAYALGIGEDPNWTAEDKEALARIRTFVERMMDLPNWLPASAIAEPEAAYDIDRLQVVVSEATPPTGTPEPGMVEPQVRDWPLADPLAAYGDPYESPVLPEGTTCAEIAGDDLATLLPDLQQANTLTLWLSENIPYQVLIRPLLPDEAACGAAWPGSDPPSATPDA